MPHEPMTSQEKKWQEHGDAHTLAEAKIINEDAERLTGAKAAADEMAKEQLERAEALKQVSEMKRTGKIMPDKKLDKMFPNTKD